MLITNKFKQHRQPIADCHTNPKPWESAMTAMVTIFGKNS
jgi:hypothetical protein